MVTAMLAEQDAVRHLGAVRARQETLTVFLTEPDELIASQERCYLRGGEQMIFVTRFSVISSCGVFSRARSTI